MCSNCPWLPEMAQVSPWQHGGPNDTYEMLYAIFRRNFIDSHPHYCGQEVWHFPEREDGKEKLFWHLTSRKDEPKLIPRRKQRYATSIQRNTQRYPDFRRSERLPWIRPMIENSQQLHVLAWDYLEGSGKIHTYVWLQDHDFVVIMKKYRNGSRRLITSFYVDIDRTKRGLHRKYTNKLT